MKTTSSEIAKSIIQRIRPDEGSSENAIYHFQCPETGRFFEIRRYDEDSDYYLNEYIPIGIWDAEKGRRVFEEQYKRLSAQTSPNQFRTALRHNLKAQNIDDPKELRYQTIRTSSGSSGSAILLKSINECAEKISQSLNEDAYYVSRQPPRERTIDDEINEIKQSVAFWKLMVENISTVEIQSVFKGTSDLLGKELGKGTKNDLLNYFNAPTHELWDRLYSTMIVNGDTLWKAWITADEMAPRSKPENEPWPRIPGGEQLRAAIVEYVESSRQRAEDNLAENQALLEVALKRKYGYLKLVNDRNSDGAQSACPGM